MPTLEEQVVLKLSDYPKSYFDPYLKPLVSALEGRAGAIVVYGSCLSSVTRKATSVPDFYVIAPTYRSFHGSWFHAAMNWILPPSIYDFRVEEENAKYNVISVQDLLQATSPCARDVYHLGRFSKRVAIAWSREDRFVRAVVKAQASALRVVSRTVFCDLPRRFTLDEMIRKALALSYEGELRVEASDKIDRLYAAEKEHYDAVFTTVLAEMACPPCDVRQNADGTYERTIHPIRDFFGRLRLSRLVRRSRLRAKLRWPKGMVTVRHWVDMLISKVERTHGIRIELSERERKWPLIFGWKHFFHLKKRRILK